MSGLDSLRNTQVSPKTAVISIVGLLILCGFGIFIARSIANQSASTVSETPAAGTHQSVKVDVKESAKAGKGEQSGKGVEPVKSEDAATIVAERDIFKPVSAASEGGSNPGGRFGGLIPPMNPGALPGMPGMSDLMQRFGGRGRNGGTQSLAYTGIVETPDGIRALIENTATSEGKFVGIGDTAFGMQVDDLNSHSVSLSGNGQTVELAMGENKSSEATPAAGATPDTGAAAAASPGAPVTPTDQSGLAQLAARFGFGGGRGRRRFQGGGGPPPEPPTDQSGP